MLNLQIGDLVDYHSIIGGEITSKKHRVICVEKASSGEYVAWVTRINSCVSLDALSLSGN